MSFYPFSADLWDYLEDMAYMPSRRKRDALIAAGKSKRVQIWDYFFQINPEDVGKPQRKEIQAVRADLEEEFLAYQVNEEELDFKLRVTEERLQAGLRRSLFIGLPLLFLGILLAAWQFNLGRSTNQILFCGGLFAIPGAISLLRTGMRAMSLSNARKAKELETADMKAIQERQIKAASMRIKELERQIEILKGQIPTPPSGAQVRAWLNQDLATLHKRSINQTGLKERQVPVAELNAIGDFSLNNNPIPVMGPGELQEKERIPPTFTREVNPDLNKHLTARRAYLLDDGRSVDVLYGIYYIKYIAVADDMLATYSFFFDLISGRISGESISEQYYRDVVAITTTRETRHIMLGVDSDEYILVEDAPTFTIYLAGTEERRVTFVNENYFQEIRDKLGLESTQVHHIYWIGDINRVASDTIQLLRHFLREHKGDGLAGGNHQNRAATT
jgi:hypothetical protein